MSKICFIANLFPSKRDPSFGSFVGKNYEQFKTQGYEIVSKVVIDHRLSGLKKLISYIKFISKGIAALGKRNYDFIYFHYLTYSTICLLPYLLFNKPKYVVNVHGDDLVGDSPMHKLMGLASPLVIKHSAAVVVPSKYFKEKLLHLYPWYCEHKVIVSPSGGVDFDVFKPSKGVDKSFFTLGYVSRVDEGKGWQELLDALVLIRLHSPNLLNKIKLNMYGTGAEVELLENKILEDNLSSVVTYFGALEPYQLAEKYNEMDVFVFPTHRESFGLVAVESLACGTPVLASNISPVNEVVISHINGLLFEKQNAKAIADAIVDLIEMDSVEYNQMVCNARSSVKKYSSKEVANCLDESLKKLLEVKEVV